MKRDEIKIISFHFISSAQIRMKHETQNDETNFISFHSISSHEMMILSIMQWNDWALMKWNGK